MQVANLFVLKGLVKKVTKALKEAEERLQNISS